MSSGNSNSARYVIPPPGGYQADAGAAFGAGTVRPCAHVWLRMNAAGRWLSVKRHGAAVDGGAYSIEAFSVEQPGDTPGTVRCVGCGRRREESESDESDG